MNETTATLTVSSEAFEANQPIPKRYTGDGEDVSPPLRWSGVPDGAASLALICDDPDAPMDEPFVHWVLYSLPANVDGLPEGVATEQTLDDPSGARQGKNNFDKVGYGGPAPPPGHGTHHYHFKLYALDTQPDLPPGATKQELLKAIEGHVLAAGELIGTYER